MERAAQPLTSVWALRWREARGADGGFYLAWRAITFLLVLFGFLGLATTGELGIFIILLFLGLWGWAFFSFSRPEWWRDWMTQAVVWLTLVVIGAIALNGKFASVLYLMLFLTLYKCFTLREATDHLHALIMAFFMFLACSVITNSITYMAFLFCFIILMMLDMICLTIAREGARVYAGFGSGRSERPAAGSGVLAALPVWRRLFLSSLFVGAVVLTMSLACFLALPHYSVNRIPNPFLIPMQQQTTALSGYSDDVNFGTLNNLKLDDTEVMDVTVSWDDNDTQRPFPSTLRLRGQALDRYSEKRWTTWERGINRESSMWKNIRFEPLPAAIGPVLRQQITKQNFLSVRRLFGASMPFQFLLPGLRSRGGSFSSGNPQPAGYGPPPGFMPPPGYPPSGYGGRGMEYYEPYKLRLDWNTQALQIIPMSGWNTAAMNASKYQVLSHVTDEAMPFMRALIRAGQADPGNKALVDPAAVVLPGFPFRPDPNLTLSSAEERINTFMPNSPLTLKMMEISHKEAHAPSIPEKIVQLMNWFYSDFEYSLNPGSTYGRHPLDVFLTRTHKGHCEYFASAFVLLLRAQGIPARLATGFYTSESKVSPEGEVTYIVRQSDAHAWAEVWMNGYGWLTFDPTPPDWRGRTTRMRENPSFIATLVNDVKVVWQRYFLDYSESQQAQVWNFLKNNRVTRAVVFAGQAAAETARSLMLLDAGEAHLTNREIYTRLILLVIAMVLAVILLLRFIGSRGPAGAPKSKVAFMNQLIRRLQGLGWRRGLSQTPAEFLAQVEHGSEGRWELQWLVEPYHRCRFHNESLTPDEEQRIRDLLRNLGKK